MSAPAINQKEYLKKYLSLGSDDKKKKKRKKVHKAERFQVVDDDIDLNNMQPVEGSDYNLYELAEDAPQIAGFVDERPDEVKALETFRSSKWKIIQDEHGIEDIKVQEEKGVLPKSTAAYSTEKEHAKHKAERRISSGFEGGKDSKSYDDDSDVSPPRKSQTTADSDESPPRISKDPNKPSKKSTREMPKDFPRRKEPSPSRKSKHDLTNRSRDSDESPPRKSRAKGDTNQPRKSRFNRSSDESPPRKSRFNRSSDESPPRKSRFKEDSDESPPRKSRFKENIDVSPPRKSRFNDNSDVSLPRKSRFNDNSDVSLPRKSRFKDNSDESPPRKSRFKDDSDGSPPRKSKFKEDSDDSRSRSRNKYKQPPNSHNKREHNKTRNQSDSDESPPRRSKSNPHGKSSKRFHRGSDEERLSGPAPKHESKSNKGSSTKGMEKQEKTLDGKKSGLQDSKSLRMENMEHHLREKEMFSKMGDELSGRNAVTVVRDRATGKKRDLAREAEEKEAEREKENEKKAKYSKWGKGLKQVEDLQSRLAEDLYVMSKPLARYADDEDLEKHLKEQEREGDPMQEYVRNNKMKKDKENKGKGIEAKEKYPVYQGPQPPPNRFGIRPGYRWDGVDRSSGYEQKWFQEQNARKAVQEEAYKWSTEDM